MCSCCWCSSCLADSWLLEVRLPDDFVRLSVPGQLAALSSGSGPRSGLLINLCKFLCIAFWVLILHSATDGRQLLLGSSGCCWRKFKQQRHSRWKELHSSSPSLPFHQCPPLTLSAKICYLISIDFEKRVTWLLRLLHGTNQFNIHPPRPTPK